MKKLIKRILLTIVIVVILFLGINIKIGYDMFKNSIAEKSVQTMVAEIKAKESIRRIIFLSLFIYTFLQR